MFVEEFRALAAERDQDWGTSLTTDARLTESGRMSSGLAFSVRASRQRVQELLTGLGESGTVHFLQDAGLPGRYAGAGGHDLIDDAE